MSNYNRSSKKIFHSILLFDSHIVSKNICLVNCHIIIYNGKNKLMRKTEADLKYKTIRYQ